MCDVSSPLMRRMSCPAAEDYSPRRRRSYSSSPKGLSKDAYPIRRMGCRDTSARGQPMRRMGCTEEAELVSKGAKDNLLDLSHPAHAFLSLPSNKSNGLPSLQKGRGQRRHQTGSVTSPAERTKKTSPVTVTRLQAQFRPLRDQEQPLSSDKSPTRILTTEVLELSSDDSPVRKATPPTKFRAKDLRVDVPNDDISWLQRTPLTQNNTSASSPLPLLDLSPVTMLGEGNLFLGQTSASPVRSQRLSFSPSSDGLDGSADFFKELSGSHHGSTSAPVSARRDQSETNTNSQGGTICSGDLSTTQPQRGPSTEVHRYRETLREDKQSRRGSSSGSCKVNSKERQKQFYKKHLDEAILGLRLHRQQQGEERATGGRRRNKALSCPDEAAYIAIDGMDQKQNKITSFYKGYEIGRWIVFAYLAMLVEKKIFRKIKVGFLIVGHTHDHVDQMFSRFSVALRGKKAFTMPQMQQVIQEAYVPSPVFEVLEETWDFKTIVQSRPSPVLPLHDVTFNPQFKIALGGRSDSCDNGDGDLRKTRIFLVQNNLRQSSLLEIWRRGYLGNDVLLTQKTTNRSQTSKVIDIKSTTIDGEPNKVEIQWFATESNGTYVGKYYPEKKRESGRGRATLFRQTLIFPDIRILAFDFSLTTTSRLRKTKVSQIRTQLFRLEQEVDVECGVGNANSPEDDDSGPQEQDS
ncbi:hypothetical protein R1sor_022631 [Riccia sorocarpa]|uniref:DUF7869 domain-containing protein n=1 Tax=Riccia sorocarpa TaxID=122646 RepID=A0ABD3GNR0_9MARC